MKKSHRLKKILFLFIIGLIGSNISFGEAVGLLDSCLNLDGYISTDMPDNGGYINDTTRPSFLGEKTPLQGSGIVLSKDNINDYCQNGSSDCDLYDKQIVDILPGTFSGMNIDALNIGSNYLTGLKKSTFEGIQGLNNFNFSNNEITYVETGAFDGLNLKNIDGSFNKINILPKNIFKTLTGLNTINFSSNSIQYFEGQDFNLLKDLGVINLSYNYINSISGTIFSGLNSLNDIDFSHNEIGFLNSGTFSNLNSLGYLNLSYNRIDGLKANTFQNIIPDNYLNLSLDHNYIGYMQPGAFSNISLNNLNLGFNNISSIENGVFENITQLNEITLSYNKITNFSYIKNIPKSIRILKACANNISQINVGDFSGFDNLTNIGLASNKIKYIGTGAFDGVIHPSENEFMFPALINLTNNFITDISNNPLANHSSPTASENFYRLNLTNNCLTGDVYSFSHNNTFLQWNLVNQKSCPYVEYTPNYPTSGEVIGNILFTGDATGSNILTTSNIGDPKLTHTWTENGPYTFNITGINNMDSLVKTIIRDPNNIHTYYQVPLTIIPASVDWILPKTISSSSSSISSESSSSLSSNSSNSSVVSSNSSSSSSSSSIASSSSSSSSSNIVYGGGGGGGSYIPPRSNSNSSSSNSSNSSSLVSSINSSVSSNVSSVHNVANTPISITEILRKNNETLIAYNWAKKIGLTSQPTYETFEPYGPLLRKHLARYISIFATQVLNMKPVYNEKCRQFSDVKDETKELQDYMTLSCELGMMGLWSDGVTVNDEFWPNREVPRAEFGSALSRLLYGTQYASYKGDPLYYVPHLKALKEKGIMTQIDDPWIIERRAWVVMMFQRYSEKFLNK